MAAIALIFGILAFTWLGGFETQDSCGEQIDGS